MLGRLQYLVADSKSEARNSKQGVMTDSIYVFCFLSVTPDTPAEFECDLTGTARYSMSCFLEAIIDRFYGKAYISFCNE
jgi:hypothetical protein